MKRRDPLTVLLGLLAFAAPLRAGDDQPAAEPATIWEYLKQKYDANGDGRISKKEYDRDKDTWKRLDLDGDGYLDAAEAESGNRKKPAGGKKGIGAPLSEGERAPDFELDVVPPHAAPASSTKERFKLSAMKGKQPVALIFGSYT